MIKTSAAENIATTTEIKMTTCDKKGPSMLYHELSIDKKIMLIISIAKINTLMIMSLNLTKYEYKKN